MHSFNAIGAHAYANEYRPHFRSSCACTLPFLHPLPWCLTCHVFSTLPRWSLITARARSCWQPPVCASSQGWFWGFSILCCLSARHCDIPSVIWSLILCSARWDGICPRSYVLIICSTRRDGICQRSHVLHIAWDAVDNNGLWADHLCYCSFLELGRASIIRRFDPYRVAQMVPVLCGGRWLGYWVDIPYPNLISVNPVGRYSQRWCIIFRCDVVPVYHFLNRAPYPSCNPLNTAVASFYDAVACRHIGTLKLQAHSPAGGKLPELPTRECCIIVSKLLLQWAALKEYCFKVLNDVSGVLPRQWPPNGKMCWTAIGDCQDVFAIIVGYIYPQPLPISFYR